MELKKGKMSTKDLATWMNMNYSTFRNHKKRNLEILHKFCDFEQVYGGIFIKEVYEPIYYQNMPDDEKVFLEEIKVANEGLSTVSGMSRKLREFNENYKSLSDSQVRRRMSKWNYLFGLYEGGRKQAMGEYGSRKYVYAIMISSYNQYRSLTQEENKLFTHILKSILGDQVEKVKQMMLLDQAFKNSDMSKDEYFIKRERFGLDLFPHVLKQFKKETGLQLVRIQEYKLNGIKLYKCS